MSSEPARQYVTYLKVAKPGRSLKQDAPGNVYFAWVVQSKCIKIGWSVNHPECRLREHRDRLGPMILLGHFAGSKRDEYRLHKELEAYRFSREWPHSYDRELFEPTGAVYEALSRLTGSIVNFDDEVVVPEVRVPPPIVRAPKVLEKKI